MTGIHIPGIYEPTLTAILRKAYLLAEIMTSKMKLKKKNPHRATGKQKG